MTIIYHYCDSNAFISIVEKNLLWLSSVLSMNDSGEMSYLRQVVMPKLREGLAKHPLLSGEEMLFHFQIEEADGYAACFSGKGDDLYQWQAYGSRGKGFSIGFDKDALCEHLVFTTENWTVINTDPTAKALVGMGRVHYSPEHGLEKFCDGLLLPMIAMDFSKRENIATFIRMIVVATQMVKSDVFFAENEYRLIYSPKISRPEGNESKATVYGQLEERKWRAGSYGITPYFEYRDHVKKAMRKVILGPSCVDSVARVEDFLWSHGYINVEVEKSVSTLR